ncbi:MAG: hypothetical protein JWM10_483 [Myxococcaceae bacterium]|nr:hypothetical protein [Myxococcaceae bacterium]
MRTLTMDTAASPFRAEHARILRAHERSAVELPPGEALRERYDETVRVAAVHAWRERMVNEHRSAAVFAGLVPQLIEASSTIDVQTVALRAATDEIYHATLCGEVVRAFGGEALATAEPTLMKMPEHPGLAALERAVRNVTFVGCLSETVAVALIAEERELADEPFVRATLDRILPDEVAHARLGWLYLAHSLPALGEGAAGRMGRYLRVAFAYLERREIDLLPLTPPTIPAELRAQREAVGLCEGGAARSLFYRTVTEVIVPRFEALGIDAADAWQHRGEN